MMPFIYLVIWFFLGLLVLAFVLKDPTFGSISAMGIIMVGVYTAINGLEGINNFVTQGLALIFIMLGFYIFIRGGIESLKQ